MGALEQRNADDADAPWRGLRVFAGAVDEPRARRATDALLLVVATIGLLVLSVAAVPTPGFARALATYLATWPGVLDALWQIFADMLIVVAVVILVTAAARRRWALVRDLVLAIAAAFVVSLVVGRIVVDSWPNVWESLRSAGPPPWYPSARIAVSASVVITASPHLTRPLRRVNRWIVGLAAVAAVVLGATTTLGAAASLLVATGAAAVVHVAFGSSGGRPRLDDVRLALREFGVATRCVGVADRQQAGLFLVRAEAADGSELAVKVYGRDAHDAALVSTVWRAVWLRDADAPIRLGRLQQAQHEAFVTLLARQAGIRTDGVVTAGATASDDALLVLRREGSRLADVVPEDRPSRLIARMWAVVDDLHGAGISHGQLDEHHFAVIGGELGVLGFRGAAVAPSAARRRADEAQALVTTALIAGQEAAVAAAHDALGAERLTAVLPFLQPAVLSRLQRQQSREAGLDLDALRTAAAAAAGTEAPALQQLHRITVGSILRVVLPAIALVALISALGSLDWNLLREQLAAATWWLVALGFIVSQLPRLTQAVSTLGASPVPLPLGPVYGLQLAVSYVNLAIPTSAARIAVNIRFFQRHGVPPGTAVAAGALDGFGGFVVQWAILLGLLLLTPVSLDLDLSADVVGSAARILGLVVVLAVVAVVVVLGVGRWRRFVLGWLRHLAVEAFAAIRGLRSPRRIGLLIGGNLATEVLFALALGTFTRALGYPIGLGELLLVNIGVALLSGLLPVPGGIGVAEGGLTFGLVQAGMPDEIAFGAVLMYRLSTFYLPPIWGYFSLGWLERNNHL
jgi:uncharacterized membrane protein YbhN (UPF0104 family)